MKKTVLLMPVLTVALGACGTMSPSMPDGGQGMRPVVFDQPTVDNARLQPEIKPLMRVTNGVAPEQAAYLTGKQHLGERRFDAAIRSFGQALAIDPKMVNAYVGVGVTQSLAGRQTLAIAAFRKATELDPHNPQWHANLGMAYARNGQFEAARQVLSKAWAMSPSDRRIESQYQRVTESALAHRLAAERLAAEQAQIASSGMRVITSANNSAGLRQVGTRVFELSMQGPAAVSVPLASAGSTTADIAVAMPDVASVAGPVNAQDKAPDTAPVITGERPLEATATELPLVYDGSLTSVSPQAVEAPMEIVNARGVEMVLDPVTRAEPSELTGDATIESATSEQTDGMFASPDQALELARQRLFERRLAAARIRAARTAMIGLEGEDNAAMIDTMQ